MDFEFFMRTLSKNAGMIESFVTGILQEEAQWKPAPNKWSILEIVNHLYDEEKDDFRGRLKLVLDNPEQPWPPNDPEAWAVERKYNERNLSESLKNFLRERKESLTWLYGLESPNWDNAYDHPKAGPLSAGDLLVSWVAHDLLHIAQMSLTRVEYLSRTAKPYSTGYALP